MDLLIAWSGVVWSDAHRQRARERVHSEVGWDRVLELAAWHRLTSVLYHNLKGVASDLLPEWVREKLRQRSRQIVGWSLSVTNDLLRVLQAMDERGVVAVPYKGPVLASQLYGSLGVRHSSDIDVVVRPRDYARARAILLSLGYTPQNPLSTADQALLLRSGYHETFSHPSACTLELHWAFTSPDIYAPIDLEQLFSRLQPFQVGSEAVPVFADEDLLLLLCIHGTKHRWSRLEWLLGLAELLRSAPAIDWDRVLASAGASRSRRILLLSLTLANRIFRAPVPEHVLCSARQDAGVMRLVDGLERALLSGEMLQNDEETGSLGRDLFHFRIRESLRDRIRMLAHRFSTPSRQEQWHTLSIGGHSVGLHWVLRPLLVSVKLVPALVHYLARQRAS